MDFNNHFEYNINFNILGKEHFHGMVRGLHRILDVSSDTPLPPLPRFPGKPDTMMTSPELLEERRVALELYLNTILECDVYRENPEMVIKLTDSKSCQVMLPN